ncbi:MAG: GNAT family N-acetyltransferase [Candidatus Heimdallarchaeaceae archaeon]
MSDNKPLISPFVGEKVRLRALEKEDIDAILEHWNTYETRRYLANVFPNSREDEKIWLEAVQANQRAKKEMVFVIERVEDQAFLGTCGLHNISWVDRTAVLGIAIHNPRNLNKGYGTEAMRMLLRIGFDYLNLHRIELEVLEHNPRAIHVYKKVGFKEVGRRRQVRYLEGKYFDSIIMDILKEEFEEIYKE